MSSHPPVSFAEATHTWLRVGLLSFGGPAGQIAVMHRILVDEKRWISEPRFLHALNYCMLLPGPEAQQLATYIGWLLHGTRGGLVAGTLFVLPGLLVMLALSLLYVLWQGHPAVAGALVGLKAAVIALIIEALVRIAGRALRTGAARVLAVAAFAAITLLHVPFPVIVLAAGLLGYLLARTAAAAFVPDAGWAQGRLSETEFDRLPLHQAERGASRAGKLLALWLPLWFAPVALAALLLGAGHVFTQLGVFFSQMAVITFGGAYAALSHVAQQAVTRFGWITPAQMIDGLGLAETTPGPLILVVQFVGFLAAYQAGGSEHPLASATIGALITVWATFVPCFLWIFLGAPYVEALRGNQRLANALGAITAAVVGVIASLSLWFASHVLFARVSAAGMPAFDSLLPASAVLVAVALASLFLLRWGLARTLLLTTTLGVAAAWFAAG